MGGADLREVAAGRFQVVMVGNTAGRRQPAGGRFVENPQRGGGIDARLGPDPADGLEDGFPLAGIADAGAGGDDAVAVGAFPFRLAGAGHDRLHVLQAVDRRLGPVMGRLGAEGAVFGTAARFGVDDGTELDPVAEGPLAQPVGAGHGQGQIRPPGFEQGHRLAFAQGVPLGALLGQFDELDCRFLVHGGRHSLALK